jgi:cytidine deaminase
MSAVHGGGADHEEVRDTEMRPEDAELVELARELARTRYRPGWHSVACALRTRSGRVYTAIHLDGTVGRVAVCAEPIAIGMAIAAGDAELDTVVAVRHPRPRDHDRSIPIVSPCGMCRETLTDYGPDMTVLLPGPDGGWVRTRAADLLPQKYTRRQEPVGEHGSPPTTAL